jgi:hypothetical protein
VATAGLAAAAALILVVRSGRIEEHASLDPPARPGSGTNPLKSGSWAGVLIDTDRDGQYTAAADRSCDCMVCG